MKSAKDQFFNPKLRKYANSLTVIRAIAGLPLIIALINNKLGWAWLFLLLAALTDAADGWIARLAGGGSSWGAKLDPLADKLLLAAPILWLVSNNMLPIFAVWLLISRELLISAWRSNTQTGGPASKGGKAKTILQFFSMLLLLWPPSWFGLELTIFMQNIGYCFQNRSRSFS